MDETTTNPNGPDATSVMSSRAGAQEAPNPQPIEEVDLLRYKLYVERASKAQVLVQSYSQELQHARIALAHAAHEVEKSTKELESKYGFDSRTQMLTEDGYIVPRQQVG